VIEKSCGTLIGQKTMYVNIPANDSKSMIKKNCELFMKMVFIVQKIVHACLRKNEIKKWLRNLKSVQNQKNLGSIHFWAMNNLLKP